MNRLLGRLLKAMLLGVLVYAGFAFYRGMASIGERLSQFAWSAFALACSLAFGNYFLRFLKWEFYLARLKIRGIPKGDSFLIFLSGLVLTVTPGKVGEVFKSILLQRLHDVPVARTAPIVIADRLTDVLGIVLLIVVGSTGLQGGAIWALLGSLAVVAVLLLVSSERLASWIFRKVEQGPARARQLAPKLREAWKSLREVTSPSALVLPTMLSVVAWTLEGLALWIILRGFGEQTKATVACFFYSVATLAGALIPVPGGLGVTEGALEEQLNHFGNVSHATATSAMILVRFATLWFAVLVGFLALAMLKARYPKIMDDSEQAELGGPRARA